MKVGIYTLGCKVNTYESNYVASLFKNKGYELVDFNDICDIYIINTCSVTNNSDHKSDKIIRQAIKKNKDACIVAMGCHMEYIKDSIPDNINIAIGNYNKSKVVDYVEEWFKTKKNIREFRDMSKVTFEDMEIKYSYDHTRAFVKIEDGCNNFCSYCVIPYVRGRCRSKEFNKVLEEINSLVDNNYKEVVLTGIHTGNYGRDIGTNFSNLVEEILKTNLERLRISSIEVTELDDKFLKLLENEKLCNHLHIPLQAGSDKILKLMNRKYDKKYFLEMIKKIREVRPDISITTDIIVGFPNETEEDFLETLEFSKLVNFAKIHVFPYSKRDGTVASKMENQLDEETKKCRARKLIELSTELEDKYYNSFIGKKEHVLIEKVVDGYSYGHTSNYLYLQINKELIPNNIYEIEIKKDMFNKE